MKVRCIRAFGLHEPGDEAEVPDGAQVDPVHYEVIPAKPAAPAAPAATTAAKEM